MDHVEGGTVHKGPDGVEFGEVGFEVGIDIDGALAGHRWVLWGN